MKIKFLTILMMALAAVAVSSCSDKDSDGGSRQVVYKTFTIVHPHLEFTGAGVWKDANKTSANDQVVINGAVYSRYYNQARGTWVGFQPSQINSTTATDLAYSGPQVLAGDSFQYTYMSVIPDTTENTTAIPQLPACKVRVDNVGGVLVNSITVANNAVVYRQLMDAAAAGAGEYSLLVYGVRNGFRTGPVVVNLAKADLSGTTVMQGWQRADVSAIGTVNYYYIQLQRTGSMAHVPAAFCMLQWEGAYYEGL